jgi:hypothetical protein
LPARQEGERALISDEQAKNFTALLVDDVD